MHVTQCFRCQYDARYFCTGDDLVGPRDIKKGLHMLANADVKILEDEEDEEKDEQTDIDLEANRKKRVKKHDRTDTLTSEQMNQVKLVRHASLMLFSWLSRLPCFL